MADPLPRLMNADPGHRGSALERVHCAFAIDSQYCQHLSVVIASIIENSRAALFHFHILHKGVDATEIERLKSAIAVSGRATQDFYDVSDLIFSGFHVDGHISVASYFRLFLPIALPEQVDRLIYLDSDIVVLDDITKLWRFDLAGSPLAAAPDIFMTDVGRLGFNEDYVYFNAGILLIDLGAWRSTHVYEKLIEVAIENNAALIYHDQDVLNVVFRDVVSYLPYVWNYQARTRSRHAVVNVDCQRLAELKSQSPSIVHFTSSQKPWVYTHDVAFEKEYYRYLRLTPWKNVRPKDRTWRTVARRYTRRYAPLIGRIYGELRRRLDAGRDR